MRKYLILVAEKVVVTQAVAVCSNVKIEKSRTARILKHFLEAGGRSTPSRDINPK